MLAPLQVVVTWRAGDALVLLRGDLDLSTAGLLSSELSRVVGLATSVVVDASGLEFIDLAGVDALLAAWGTLQERGVPLAVRAPSAPVARLLRLLGDPLPVDDETVPLGD